MHKYIALVKFLIEPLLEQPDALKFDCETNTKGDRIWIRVAFDASDKGRIFGRNGRTIQAIRTLLNTAANGNDQVVRFDVFDPEPVTDAVDKSFDISSDNSLEKSQNTAPVRSFSKPKPKLKS